VAKAGRYRLKVAAAGMAAALAVGGVVGYVLSDHSPTSTQTASPAAAGASKSDNSTEPLGVQSSSGFGSSVASGPAVLGKPFTRLFTRTAGLITVRGFLINVAEPVPLAVCGFGPPQFQTEVSTPQMVGIATSDPIGQQASGAVGAIETSLVGVQEGDPVAVVTADAGATVAEVRMVFAGGGTDEMVPVKGWVALAAPVSAKLAYGQAVGTLTALDAAGKTLSSKSLTLGQSAVPATQCTSSCPPTVIPLPSAPGSGASVGSANMICRACPSPVPLNNTAHSTVVNPGGPMIPANPSAPSTVVRHVASGTAVAPACMLESPPSGAGTSSGASSGGGSTGGGTGSAGPATSAG